VKLVRAALASATTPLTEAYAAMGRVHPFFEKAGMTAYPAPMLEADARLLQALNALGFDCHDLALIEPMVEPDSMSHARSEGEGGDEAMLEARGLRQRIEALPLDQHRWIKRELRRWHQRLAGREKTNPSLATLLRAAQQRLLRQPIYYLHDNRA